MKNLFAQDPFREGEVEETLFDAASALLKYVLVNGHALPASGLEFVHALKLFSSLLRHTERAHHTERAVYDDDLFGAQSSLEGARARV